MGLCGRDFGAGGDDGAAVANSGRSAARQTAGMAVVRGGAFCLDTRPCYN